MNKRAEEYLPKHHQQKEVVIVGAGVIGCSIAYHLAKQGVPSQIIERDSIAARASGKSWAVFTYPPSVIGKFFQKTGFLTLILARY